MSTVEITVNNESYGRGSSDHIVIADSGSLAEALRSCILRVGDRFAADAEVQRLVDAVAKAMPR